ncbi:MAG: hypothetical protein KGH60_05345, partial [Candidatus Micrarchaeota archaeon]|nr:hypothetical protein [Candidatus Micrarchaeota archaeon]
SRDGAEPVEKIATYHPMRAKDAILLAVHVHGDKTFSMARIWGEGDEKLKPLCERYEGRIIRWGRQDVLDALNGTNRKKEHLY